MKRRGDQKEELLFNSVLKMNSQAVGLGVGLLFGLGIFLATNWLVLKGGHIASNGEYVVGPNLQLLSQFFLGYRVSFLGSLIGFAYGFTVGTLGGACTGWIYNKIVALRDRQFSLPAKNTTDFIGQKLDKLS